MKNPLYIAVGVLAVLLLVVIVWRWLPDEPERSVEELTQDALQADTQEKREVAVARLSQKRGPQATKQLTRIMTASESPTVRATAVQAVAARWDYEAMPDLIGAIADESPVVRARAGKAVEKMLGASYDLKASDTLKERKAKMEMIKKIWQKMKDSGALEEWQERQQRLAREGLLK